jgi:hypothetical protein
VPKTACCGRLACACAARDSRSAHALAHAARKPSAGPAGGTQFSDTLYSDTVGPSSRHRTSSRHSWKSHCDGWRPPYTGHCLVPIACIARSMTPQLARVILCPRISSFYFRNFAKTATIGNFAHLRLLAHKITLHPDIGPSILQLRVAVRQGLGGIRM